MQLSEPLQDLPQDFSFICVPMAGDVYGITCNLAPAASTTDVQIEMGDWFAINGISANTDISLKIEVEGDRVSPGTIGITGYCAPNIDKIFDPSVVGE